MVAAGASEQQKQHERAREFTRGGEKERERGRERE